MPWLAVAAGGALGAVARYGMAGLVQRVAGGAFPWGTLAVNVLGALLMGIIVEGAARLWTVPTDLRLFLTTGVLGGFTTFSAFSLDAWVLWERGMPVAAVGYVAASVGLSILALVAGFWLGRVGFGA